MQNRIRANYSLPADLVEAVRKASEETGITQAAIVEKAIAEYLPKVVVQK